MITRYAFLLTGLMLSVAGSAGEPAIPTAKISEVRFAAGNSAIVSTKSSFVRDSKRQGVSLDMQEAVIEVVDGPAYEIGQATYYPRAKKLRLMGGIRFQSLSGGPLDDHDGTIEVTCSGGKVHRNGIPTDKSSVCMGEGVRMTCDPVGTGATIDFADPTCSGFDDP